jgi:predicted MFS family arabinose efflux permease
MEPTKPTVIANVGRKLRALDQWLIRINTSWDGSGRVKFGSATSIVVIAITAGGYLVAFLLERQTSEGISTVTLVGFVLMTLCLVYTFRTLAEDRPRSNAPQ